MVCSSEEQDVFLDYEKSSDLDHSQTNDLDTRAQTRSFTNTRKNYKTKKKNLEDYTLNFFFVPFQPCNVFTRANPSHYSSAQKLDVRMVCSLPLHTNLHVLQRQRMLTASREGMTPDDVINADASATPGKNTLERFSCHSHFRTCKQESTSTKPPTRKTLQQAASLPA